MALYVNQSIEIKLICTVSAVPMSTAVSGVINYKKPSGATGAWTAVVDNGDGSLNYDASTSDIDEAGKWILQPEPTLGGGTVAPGVPVEMAIRARFT